MILIKSIIYILSIVLTAFLGLFVFFSDRKRKVNRTFFFFILAILGWLITLFLFYAVESPRWVLWIGRANFAAVLPLLYFLFRFTIIFPREIRLIPEFARKALASWFFIFTILILFTPLVDKAEVIIGPEERETIYGPLYSLYIIHYIIFALAGIIILFYKLKRSREKIEKYQLIYLLSGIALGLLWGFVTNILLPLFKFFEAQNYGPLAPVILSSVVAVAIFKHYLFNIKVIATEALVVLLSFLLFINIFSYNTFGQLILNIAIFLGALVFGVFLIKSVLQEVKTREKIERLAGDLERANTQLMKLDKARTEFMSMASHQLRTPLTAIKGYISLAMEGQYGKMSKALREKLKNVYLSNERLINLVGDLLTVSRIEMGKLTAEKEPAQIVDLIKSSVEEMKLTARKKGLKLFFAKPKTRLPKINIDTLKIRQVILNLIDNAIKYTPKGEIKIEAKKKASVIQITVKDTGEGLTKEEKETIFEGFTRGRAGTVHFIEGAGLGLYVAKKYIDLHQGKIWAESKGKSKGATFYIELPIK